MVGKVRNLLDKHTRELDDVPNVQVFRMLFFFFGMQ